MLHSCRRHSTSGPERTISGIRPNVTRLRGLPLYRALERAVARNRYQPDQERELREAARLHVERVATLSRPMSQFAEKDWDQHMRVFVLLAGGPDNFGMDPLAYEWPDLSDEVRRRALGHRTQERRRARRDAFSLTEKTKPATWRKMIERTREMGAPWPQELSPERANAKVQSAVAKGRLVRPTSCAACGLERELEPYHYDYRRPLSVVWACEECRARQRSSGTTIVVVTPTVRAVVSSIVWSRGGRI